MKSDILFFMLFLLTGVELSAEKRDTTRQPFSTLKKPSDGAGVFTIYPGDGIPAHSGEVSNDERTIGVPVAQMTRNVVIPTITMYQPAKGEANGTVLIADPGGLHIS